MNIGTDSIPEISREGFQVVSADMFQHSQRMNVPTATLWINSISFSKATLVALNSCERIRIEVNPQTRCILIMPVTAKDKDSVKWVKTGKEPTVRKIECRPFTEQLYEKWGWINDHAYRATGKIVTADKKVMMLFDFSDPESWKYKEKAKAAKNV